MSMIVNLRTASDATIDRLLADPQSIIPLLYPGRPATAPPKQSLFSLLFGKKPSPPPPAPPTPPPQNAHEGIECDLDKAWHGIHFLLTGSDWEGDPPLNFLLCGGTVIGDVDVGYGPARAMRPAEVKAATEALAGISSDELRRRFDPARMMQEDIYPTIWDRDPAEDDTLGYLIEYYGQLKAFLAEVTAKNLGLLIYMY